ncbi:penicillin acylase family protein [Nocardia sp. N13]|uniref:penicillin acylase family protein n=1 Tax=Nocardioides sp. N13(2025) TaxID=3453405 RepID=UPI003F776EDC
MRTRLTALVSLAVALALVPPTGAGSAAAPQAAQPRAAATAPAFRGYEASVVRTRHGIPHITAKNWGSLGFGAGYAATETTACNLLDTLVTARGERSRWLGPDGRYDDQVTLDASNLQVDAFVTDLRNRRVVEKLLADPVAGPGKEARAMVRGYAAGATKYLRTHRVKDPACKGAGFVRTKATALDLWYGVYLANLLASSGVFVKEIVDADPPSPTDPGLPELPLASAVDRDALLRGLGKDPTSPFGSNATAVGGDASTTKRGMLLGNPHFPWRGRYRFTQQHLTIPGKYDVAGASLVGSPVVNIGWNKRVAWSHTVSTAYRFTPYEYRTAGPTTIVTESGPQALERRTVDVRVKQPDGTLGTVSEDLYRTPQGYVIDAPALLMPWSPASLWAIHDANGEHLRTIDTFLDMGKARGVRSLLRRQDAGGGMPWVNTTAADRNGNVLYADHSVVPHVTDDLAQQCMTPVGRVLFEVAGLPGLDGTRAASSCAWGTDADAQRPGVFGPQHLPAVVRRDWVANANDSYWLPNPDVRLEGYARIIGCEKCERTPRTRMVYRYVQDRLSGADGRKGRLESPRTLAAHEYENRVYAGLLVRENDDLAKVCQAAGGADACDALARWDGRSATSSIGYHLVEEFVQRLPEDPWAVAFDPAQPLATPRDLKETDPAVVAAMRDAIAFFRTRGTAMHATWGSLQVAGDRGAPAQPISGGTGDALGNANAVSSRDPLRNSEYYRAITYGSSHIQAIAFTDHGLRARTVLTYGQADDPTSPWHADQTRLYSRSQWVSFPWTPRQVRRQQVASYVVRGR